MIGYVRNHFQSLVSIAVRGASVLAGFVVTYFIGHAFGPEANGQYALIAQTGMFLSIVAVGGMDLAIVRYFSATRELGVPLGRRSLLRVVGYSLGAGLLIVLALAASHRWILQTLFHGAPPAYGVTILACVVMTRTATRVTGAVLRSQSRHLLGQVIEVLAIPLAVALLLAAGVISSLLQVLYATALAGLAVGGFGLVRTFAATSAAPGALDVPFRSLLRTSLPLWLTVIAMNVADWWNLATAATALGVYEAGLFRVAFQIGTALSFSATGINNVFTQRISAAIATGDVERIARLSRQATRLTAVVLTPVVAVLFIGGDALLGLIGPQFREAAPLLRIILAGQLIYVASGPAGLVLAMTGHERVNLAISASVTGALLFLAPVAAHVWGLYGLAVLTALVPIAGNGANMIAVRRLERINTVTGRYFGPPRQAAGS